MYLGNLGCIAPRARWKPDCDKKSETEKPSRLEFTRAVKETPENPASLLLLRDFHWKTFHPLGKRTELENPFKYGERQVDCPRIQSYPPQKDMETYSICFHRFYCSTLSFPLALASQTHSHLYKTYTTTPSDLSLSINLIWATSYSLSASRTKWPIYLSNVMQEWREYFDSSALAFLCGMMPLPHGQLYHPSYAGCVLPKSRILTCKSHENVMVHSTTSQHLSRGNISICAALPSGLTSWITQWRSLYSKLSSISLTCKT